MKYSEYKKMTKEQFEEYERGRSDATTFTIIDALDRQSETLSVFARELGRAKAHLNMALMIIDGEYSIDEISPDTINGRRLFVKSPLPEVKYTK